jgi:peptidoglycan/LPS O-acetylase OafA/YrhL
MGKENYYILNILRGMSALFVLFYHFFVFFFAHQTMSASLLQIEPVEMADPFYLQAIIDLPIDIGHLGVAFFFLISGFLIQPSLERYGSLKTYIVHKVFRLWPSYAICFGTGLLFVWAFSELCGWTFPYSFDHVLSYFFWARDIFHYAFIDGAVWSLEVQMKFYIFAGLIWSMGKKNFLEKICLITLVLSAVVYGLYTFFEGEELSWFYLVSVARRNLKFFLLILMGSCLYSFSIKQISWQKTLVLCGVLLACFMAPLFRSPDLAKTISYLLGFSILSYFVVFPVKNTSPKGRLSHFINWVSGISYPLYIGHVLPGYVMMYFMIDQGYSVYWGILMALIYSFVMAEIVHKKIETFFINSSTKLFSYFSPSRIYP